MPELPEVETVCRSLRKYLIGQKINKIDVISPVVLVEGVKKEDVLNKEILSIDRKGKYILINLADDYLIGVHLRMTGKLLYWNGEQNFDKHTHLVFYFNENEGISYNDIRKFGKVWLTTADKTEIISGLNQLGPEPISDNFNVEVFKSKIKGKTKTPVKNVILDQHIVAGIGNIYADEILFDAKINPFREIGSLNDEELTCLCESMRKILNKSIENRGTTFRDYVDADNQKGSNQENLKVYTRAGKPCVLCGKPLSKDKIGGRSTCYCENCQK